MTRARTRWPALLAALSGLAVAVLLSPGPAAADEVASAQARVDALQAVARRSTEKLEQGTRAWQDDLAALRRTKLTLRNTRRHLAESKADAAAAVAKVDLLAAELYRRPQGRGLTLLFASDADTFLGSAQALDALDHAAGGQDRIIRDAAVARLQIQRQERTLEQATAHAKELVARSATRLRDLQALAARTARELDQAQQALVRAKDRARAARASRSRSFTGGGAFCTGKSTAGQANGNLDPASLCPLWMAPGHRLRSDAAAAFNKMSQYHAATVGGPLCVTDSYRSYSEQAALYRRKPGLAAVPGKSEHGWGKAVDFCGGVQDFDSAAHQWMKDNAGKFGWYHPDWARRSGNRPEAWHWEFSG